MSGHSRPPFFQQLCSWTENSQRHFLESFNNRSNFRPFGSSGCGRCPPAWLRVSDRGNLFGWRDRRNLVVWQQGFRPQISGLAYSRCARRLLGATLFRNSHTLENSCDFLLQPRFKLLHHLPPQVMLLFRSLDYRATAFWGEKA